MYPSKSKFPSTARFVGCLFLLQVLATAAGLGVLLLFVDWFGDGTEFYAYGWAMLPLWLLWGILMPRRARPEGKWSTLLPTLWTGLTALLALLLPDYRMLLAMPQMAAGSALARLWPGSHHSALFIWTVEPIAQGIAHLLLPALLWAGLWLRGKEGTEW